MREIALCSSCRRLCCMAPGMNPSQQAKPTSIVSQLNCFTNTDNTCQSVSNEEDERLGNVGTNQGTGTHHQCSPSFYAGLPGTVHHHRQSPFSTCMFDLRERSGLFHISNQVLQITQDYNYSPPHAVVTETAQIQLVCIPTRHLVRGFLVLALPPRLPYHIRGSK